MQAICTIRKLKFVSRTTAREDGVASRAFSSLVDDVETLCLVKECRDLEERYKVNYTSKIFTTELEDRHSVIKEMVQTIHKKDLALQLQSASNLEHLCKITDAVGRNKLWDHVLDHGEACVTLLKKLVRVMSHPLHASRPCPLCEITELKESLPVHVINEHTAMNHGTHFLALF